MSLPEQNRSVSSANKIVDKFLVALFRSSCVKFLVEEVILPNDPCGHFEAFPLLFHENPESRTFFAAIPNPVFSFQKIC